MTFVCIGYYDVVAMKALATGELEALMASCRPHLDVLRASERLRVDAGVEPFVAHLRRSSDRLEVDVGTRVAAGDAIGSVFMLEATDLGEALRLAALHPTVAVAAGERLGWRLEVRPLHHYEERSAIA